MAKWLMSGHLTPSGSGRGQVVNVWTPHSIGKRSWPSGSCLDTSLHREAVVAKWLMSGHFTLFLIIIDQVELWSPRQVTHLTRVGSLTSPGIDTR